MVSFLFAEGVSESARQCQCMYDMFSHHCLPFPSWCFTLMKKEVPALIKCVTTGNPDQVNKWIMGIFTYLSRYNPDTKTLPPPEPVELRAMICCGMMKEMLPLPMTIKVHRALDFLMTLLDKCEIVPDEEICKRPVFKVHGECDECQRLLMACPTKKDVGLSKTCMYVMMPNGVE